jgi:hypothetical protein
MRISEAVQTLARDLAAVFDVRLRSLVAYDDAASGERAPTPTLAVVDELTANDLRACADRVASWHDAGLATPLILRRQEFDRSLDAFPYEFGAILANHVVVTGENPFNGLSVDPAHLRHACEVQARSHLLHLREGYLETRGRSDALADLLSRSAAPLSALVKSVARLRGDNSSGQTAALTLVEQTIGVTPGSLGEVVQRANDGTLRSDEARRIFPGYLDAVERLTHYVDSWGIHER